MAGYEAGTGQPRLIYVSGGCRSGKSDYAQNLAEAMPGTKAYLATSPVIDIEMEHRIELHRQARRGKGWTTFEEPVHLPEVLKKTRKLDVVLIDCLTLWVNNLLFAAQQQEQILTEEDIDRQCQAVLAEFRGGHGTLIVVSNELGMGLVPPDRVSRLYRDLVGRCNRIMAQQADEAYFLVSGLPLKLK